ncbi:hypothetical protein ACJJIU_13120 [Microbulbifer sp. CnH-101-E]|uniref:hypothetical protein n=1 Tax=unclassified Microbulbifer TaxID=2619833 RepID=UPI00403A048F
MSIEDLRQIRNKNVAQQNELTYLEMKECADSFGRVSWLPEVLATHGHTKDSGILISLSDVPDQGGTLWIGSWLATNKTFYEFEVLTNREATKIIEVESWLEVAPEISAHEKGIGKTPACITLELLSEYGQS